MRQTLVTRARWRRRAQATAARWGQRLAGALAAAGLWHGSALAARAGPSSPFAPASPDARAIADLFVVLLVIAGLLFVLVQGLLIYMTWRFRERPGRPEPRPVFGNPRLEVGWTVTPAVLLVGVFLLSLPTLRGTVGPRDDALEVEVTGHQFWWEYRYTAQGLVTANELHIPVGQPVHLRLQSADVIHSY